MRKIGVPFALVGGEIKKNCIFHIDDISKKVCNIVIEATEMDRISLLEYFNGLLIPMVTGWEHPMTTDKRKALICNMNIDNLSSLTPEPLTEGYIGELLLLEKLDFKNLAIITLTTIKRV